MAELTVITAIAVPLLKPAPVALVAPCTVKLKVVDGLNRLAAGVNFNNVWAARGQPVDVIAQRQRAGGKEDFHVGGSDASGIVYEVGEGVTGVKVGDHVIVHPGYWDANDPWIKAGKDPMISASARI